MHKKHGRPAKLSISEQILMTLEYYREYPSYFSLSKRWGVSESTVCRTVEKTEKILINHPDFHLPGKKALLLPDSHKITAMDTTESPIERPSKKQKKYYSGKQKQHTIKSQVIINLETKEIICTAFDKGSTHDFTLFKKSKTHLQKEIECYVDKGYQGIQNLHKNTQLPKKKPKNGQWSKADKKRNRNLSSERVAIEHVNRELKVFKILGETYRNRRKRFQLRFNLIAAIYNYDLKVQSNR